MSLKRICAAVALATLFVSCTHNPPIRATISKSQRQTV
jgi:hypothetical protein